MMNELSEKIKTFACLVMKQGSLAELPCLVRNYCLVKPFTLGSDQESLSTVMNWLCRAQDVCGGKGVSVAYHLRKGWDLAYPETSGYIIATFLLYGKTTGNYEFIRRAVELGDWEIDIQAVNGGVLSNPVRSDTRVFNTGQVMLGWCALYEHTGEARYLEAACRAGNYLVSMQESDGTWQCDTYCGARTYHARVDWALIRLASISGNSCYLEAAIKNLSWVIQQQNDNGWFNNCGFKEDDPITHVIIYTLRGILESYLHGGKNLPDLGLLPAVINAVEGLCNAASRYPVRGMDWLLPASFDANWKSRDNWSCLTGNAQFACLLFRLSDVTDEQKYRVIGGYIVEALKATQNISTPLDSVKGAIGGSWPLYGAYCSNAFPNWAAKFFADALMMRMYPALSPVAA